MVIRNPGSEISKARNFKYFWLALAAAVVFGNYASAEVSVLTYHNDNARTGQNLSETKLTLSNVNVDDFGKLFTCPVDGYIYAQPLVLSGVNVPGKGVRNLVFIATEHDSVYAFDADRSTGTSAEPIWTTRFIDPEASITTVPTSDLDLGEPPELGITGTPVIDAGTGTLYVVARTKLLNGPSYRQALHALDVATGAEKLGGPVTIDVSVPGSGDGHDANGQVAFDPLHEFQRAGLVLAGGVVYVTFASAGDIDPYHGWIIGYDAKTLQVVRVFNDTPNAKEGGIWMSGAAPAVDDAGYLYCLTGNGTFDPAQSSFGDTALKLRPMGSELMVSDYFTPYDQENLDIGDGDLGSGGCLLLPESVGSAEHRHLLVGCGKEGTIYLLDTDNMGGFNPAGDWQIVQSVTDAMNGEWGMPAYYNGWIYFQGFKDYLKAFSIGNGQMSTQAVSQSAVAWGYPNGTPSISANQDRDAIVWIIETDAFYRNSSPVLRAYNATNLTEELYNSSQSGGRDDIGLAQKFAVPTIANGKVYVASAGMLGVYGNLKAPTITAQPVSRAVLEPASLQLSIEAEGPPPITYQWFIGSAPIDGATNAVLEISSLNSSAGNYSVEVSNLYGSTLSDFTEVVGAGDSSGTGTNNSGGGVLNNPAGTGDSTSPAGSPIETPAADQPPSISPVSDQTMKINSFSSVAFAVHDAILSANEVRQEASSSNPALVPNENLFFGGVGTNRMLIIVPAKNQVGTARITITASAGDLTAQMTFGLTVTNTAAVPLDFNGDGKSDLLWQSQDGTIGAWFMDGASQLAAQSFEPATAGDRSWQLIGSGDFNGDGQNDLVWQHLDGTVAFWLMNGTKRMETVLLSQPGDIGWRLAGVGDFNGDNKPDLVWQHDTGTIGVWMMDGTNRVSAQLFNPPSAMDRHWRIAAVADLNGDGQPDLIWQHDEGWVGVWYMQGATLIGTEYLTPNTPGDPQWRLVAAADYDGDGKIDLVWQHASGTVAFWFMDGSHLRSAQLAQPSNAGTPAWSIARPRRP